MRVMPSVTDTIEPTLRASVTALKFSIRCLMRSLISVALMAISSVPVKAQFSGWSSGSQFVGDAVKARAQRAVDHQIARAQHRAADELGIDRTVQSYRALESLLQRGGELALLTRIHRRGGSDRDVGDALRGVLELIEQRADLRQVSEAPVDGEHAHEVRALTPKLRPRDATHQLRELLGRHARISQEPADARVPDYLGRHSQRLGPGFETLVAACLGEGRAGVGSGDGEPVSHGARPSDLRRELVEEIGVR